MSIEKREVERSLESKGFERSPNKHNNFIYFTKSGKKSPARTGTSHSKKMKTIPDSIISEMAKQCKLTKAEFEDLINCPMSRDQYEQKLRERGNL